MILIILVVPIVVSSSQQVRPMITALTITIAVVASITIAIVAAAVVATSIFIRVVRLLLSLSTVERK